MGKGDGARLNDAEICSSRVGQEKINLNRKKSTMGNGQACWLTGNGV